MKKITILYSGGLDSFIMKKLAETMGNEVKLVHYDIGQPYSEKEMNAIQNSGFDVEIRKLDWLNVNDTTTGKDGTNSGAIFIPGRNMALASMVACTDLPDEVWMGGLKGEDHAKSTDKNQTFIDKTNEQWSYVFSQYDTIPKLVFPFLKEEWGKFEAVEWAYTEGGATKEELLRTSSCLSGEPGNCGHCVVCARRKYIFKQLGFEETYNQDPLTGEDNLKMFISMLENPNGEGHYDKYRIREIVPGLHMEFGTTDNNYIIERLQMMFDNVTRDL